VPQNSSKGKNIAPTITPRHLPPCTVVTAKSLKVSSSVMESPCARCQNAGRECTYDYRRAISKESFIPGPCLTMHAHVAHLLSMRSLGAVLSFLPELFLHSPQPSRPFFSDLLRYHDRAQHMIPPPKPGFIFVVPIP
jgi:hypothetical protein